VSVPQLAPVQPVPESDQVTPAFDGSFMTVATMGTVCPCRRPWTEDGDKLMEIGGPELQPAANTTSSSNPMETSANAGARFGRDDSEPGCKRNGFKKNGADMGPPLGNRTGVDGVMRPDSPLPENVFRPRLPLTQTSCDIPGHLA